MQAQHASSVGSIAFYHAVTCTTEVYGDVFATYTYIIQAYRILYIHSIWEQKDFKTNLLKLSSFTNLSIIRQLNQKQLGN